MKVDLANLNHTTELLHKDKDGNIKEHRRVTTKDGIKTELNLLTNKIISKTEVSQ